jgi:hypothetical protein
LYSHLDDGADIRLVFDKYHVDDTHRIPRKPGLI